MSNKLKRNILFTILIIIYLIFTYSIWWMSIIGSIFIIFISFFIFKEKTLYIIGLKIDKKDYLFSLILLIFTVTSTYFIVNKISLEKNIIFIPFYDNLFFIKSICKTVGQTINEEIVLGALLLNYIKSFNNHSTNSNNIKISLFIALIFSIAHFLFFYYTNHDILNIKSLISLFFIGVIRNNFILNLNNIAYSLSIHFGLNLVIMDSIFYLENKNINEVDLFNIFCGNNLSLLVFFIFTILSFSLYKFDNSTFHKKSK